MPRFSVVTPVHDPSVDGLRACADSVLGQSHSDWEWVISDDASSDAEVVAYLDELARDQRVTLIRREVNGGIVAATNDALRVATGEFVTFLDHDDLLTPDALSAVDEVLLGDDSIDFLYSDEDKIDDDGNRSQRFTKPAWSPERLRAQNYCSHLSVMRRALVDEVGGLRAGFDGAQDYDLVLRVSERARAIAHIPKVLYHWRMSSGSTAANADAKPYALEAGRRAVVEHLERCGIWAEVSLTEQRYLRVRRAPTSRPRVSLIIPTNGARGRVWGQTMTLVENCVASTVERSTYPDLEIVVVHDMVDEALLSRLRSIAGDRLVEVPFDRPFNFSEKINLGVVRSTGSIVVPLNDDAMVASPDWVETLVAHLEEDEVGMVGPRLLLADGRIQSAGHYNKFGPHHVAAGCAADETGPIGLLTLASERSGLTLACAALRRSVFDEVGGLSEVFPGAFNDVDLAYKLQRAGYRLVWTPEADLFHFESLSRDPSTRPIELTHLFDRWGVECATADWFLPRLDLQMAGAALGDDLPVPPQTTNMVVTWRMAQLGRPGPQSVTD